MARSMMETYHYAGICPSPEAGDLDQPLYRHYPAGTRSPAGWPVVARRGRPPPAAPKPYPDYKELSGATRASQNRSPVRLHGRESASSLKTELEFLAVLTLIRQPGA